MKRTTITLSDDLAILVEYEAKRQRTTVSEVIRESIVRTYLDKESREIPFAGICDDAGMPPAARLDESLEGWADDLDRRR